MWGSSPGITELVTRCRGGSGIRQWGLWAASPLLFSPVLWSLDSHICLLNHWTASGRKRFMDVLAGGWQINGIISVWIMETRLWHSTGSRGPWVALGTRAEQSRNNKVLKYRRWRNSRWRPVELETGMEARLGTSFFMCDQKDALLNTTLGSKWACRRGRQGYSCWRQFQRRSEHAWDKASFREEALFRDSPEAITLKSPELMLMSKPLSLLSVSPESVRTSFVSGVLGGDLRLVFASIL